MKWYITGGRYEDGTWNTGRPFIAEAETRLDAIVATGLTVWSEDEWPPVQPTMQPALTNGDNNAGTE